MAYTRAATVAIIRLLRVAPAAVIIRLSFDCHVGTESGRLRLRRSFLVTRWGNNGVSCDWPAFDNRRASEISEGSVCRVTLTFFLFFFRANLLSNAQKVLRALCLELDSTNLLVQSFRLRENPSAVASALGCEGRG